MDRVTSAKVFVQIVSCGSMTEAANVLDMSRSMVTRYLKEMENWADARLLHRSTRRLSLTPAGEQVLEHCLQILAVVTKLEGSDLNHEKQPKGLLRVSASHFLAKELIAPLSQEFLLQYPGVSLDIFVSNDAVDLVADRIDLAVRITNSLDPNLIARPLGSCNSMLCATPSYLKKNPKINSLNDLMNHNCLSYSYFGNNVWQFEKDNDEESVFVQGNFSANESTVLLQAALKNVGISMLPRHSVLPFVDSGELVEVLPDYKCQPFGVFGVYRSREHMPLVLRKFIDFLVENFQSIDM